MLLNLPNVTPLTTDKRHIFICGCGHSGTTLLAAKLALATDALLIARETNAFLPEVGAYCAKRIVIEWNYFANWADKDFIIEKTPKHVHCIPRIAKVLPSAKIVLITRNPLDTIASLYKRLGSIEAATHRWRIDTEAAVNAQKYANTILVKYEDLICSPHHEFGRVSKFCGLRWHPSYLGLNSTGYDSVSQKGNMINRAEQVRGKIRNNIGGWKDVLTESQVHYIVRYTSSAASKAGYKNCVK
ncbi:sulfotransferase [Salinisphaera sp. PC39]|uniref:sulfotransferase family protein n=1 Tax=Salinisphaera sp. PC39 TaxID=1304156 RepID=UPI00333FE38D